MDSQPVSAADRAISFGPFRLFRRQRLLLESGKPVRIGTRAFDLLIALLDRPGELLSKEELISRVWPSTHVVEGNLKYQIAALRRALQDGQNGRRYLETSSGQGYRFVADVALEDNVAPSRLPTSPATSKHNLPARLTSFIGRADLVAKLARRLPAGRLITIVGPGGIGKTSVATALATQLIGSFEDGVWSVGLGRFTDPAFVQSAVAAACGININPENPLEGLLTALNGAHMLLVLDDCSHLVDAVASLVVAILKSAPGMHILATSREPLRVEGEYIYRLGPLETPPASERLSSSEALEFPAVQLFVERAASSEDGFTLRDEDAPRVGEICRKLDGIPLAIELAAARVDLLGVRGLSAQLDHGLQVLTGGRRTALPRHRTMRAALDWSYSLLSPSEQAIFSRLAVFAGGFTLSAAAAVICDAKHPEEEIVTSVLELATKSLVVADEDFDEPRFRLPITTRAYAMEKLKDRGEAQALAQRHAAYLLKLFEAVSRVDAEFDKASATLASEIDNLRAALSWAFTPSGDLAVGIGLTAASVPLWLSMSLIGEWHIWADKAIRSLTAARLCNTQQEMVLQATLGISFQLVRNSASDAHPALTRALQVAEHLGDTDYQLRILHTFWIYHTRTGDVRAALTFAHRADTIAGSLADPVVSATAEWMLGISLHWAGQHDAARRHLEQLLQGQPLVPERYFVHRAGFDLYVAARYILGHILWLRGFPDRAMQTVEASLEEARRLRNPWTLCSALAFGGCTISFHIGDLDAAERLAAELVGYAQRYALGDFFTYGKAVQEILALRRGRADASPEQLSAAIERWRTSGWHILLSCSDLAEGMAKTGYSDEIAVIVDQELERAERSQALAMVPEMLRIKGDLLLMQSSRNVAAAKDCFLRSLEQARAQGATSWELRTALSLARLERSQGRTKEALQLLRGIYERFSEGFGSSDLKLAKQVLEELQPASGVAVRPLRGTRDRARRGISDDS